MNLQFIAAPQLSKADVAVCRDYFLGATSNSKDYLSHIASIYEEHIISIEQLAYYVNEVATFDSDIHCQHCEAMYPIFEAAQLACLPSYWVCTKCLINKACQAK